MRLLAMMVVIWGSVPQVCYNTMLADLDVMTMCDIHSPACFHNQPTYTVAGAGVQRIIYSAVSGVCLLLLAHYSRLGS